MEVRSKLNEFNVTLGQEKREWIDDIMEVLSNEPEPDEPTKFNVFEVTLKSNNECILTDTGQSFYQNIIAEEWVKESGLFGSKYTILKIMEPQQ